MLEIKMYGADWCPDCQRAKAFLKEHGVEYNFIDVDQSETASSYVEKINKGKRIIPTFEVNGETLTNPDNSTLAAFLGLNPEGRVQLFGADWCPDCQRAKVFLKEQEINFQFIDVDEQDWATDIVVEINRGKRIIPTILIDGMPYSNPDNPTLTRGLGLDQEREERIYDSIIIGAGAAGLTTALYAQRDGFSTLILEKRNIGGNAYLTEKIENYPGFEQITGPELTQKMADHARKFGAAIKQGVVVDNIEKINGLFEVETNSGLFRAKTVVVATGSSYRKLRIPNEDQLIGSGVHFCATCDGAFYKNKEVIVIGGGNSALEEGLHLASLAEKVTFVNITEEFTATSTYIDQLNQYDNIEVLHNRTSLEFKKNGTGQFEALKVRHNDTGVEEWVSADGAFIFIGLQPNTAFVKDLVDLNERHYIKTNQHLETNVAGIFAAGDNREGAIAQVAFATGEGVAASYGLRKYLKQHQLEANKTALAV
jgi:thioredoxin reductase (NADPH)